MSFALRAASSVALAVVLAIVAGCTSAEERAAGHMAKARALMATEDFPKARIEAKNVLQIEPRNAEAHFMLAQIAWRESNFGLAFPELEMAVEADPSLVDARLKLGDLYVATQDIPNAEGQVEALRKLAPDRADVRLLEAKVKFIKGDQDGALAGIDLALAADPAYVPALLNKASLLNGRKQTDAALATIDEGLARAKGADADSLREFRLSILLSAGRDGDYEAGLKELIAAYPERSQYLFQLLDYYAGRGRAVDEEKLLATIVARDPANARATLRLSNRMVRRKDIAAAEALMKGAVARFPDNAELLLGLGDLYRATERPAEAMATYRKAVGQFAETSPDGIKASNRVVSQLIVDGKVPEAKAAIEEVLKAAPDDGDALLVRATFSYLEGRYDAAIADLRGVIRRQESPGSVLLLARSYLGAGDLAVAKDTYRQLLQLDPRNVDGAKELAALLADAGDARAAADILRGTVALRPTDAKASVALVQSLLAQRDLEAAEAEARRMIEQGAGGTEAQEQMGRVLEARGSKTEALASYRALLDRDPKQPAALERYVSLLLEAGRPGEVLDFLGRYPADDLVASLLRGRAFSRQGDVVAARQEHERAIGVAPKDPRAYLGLAALSPADSPEQVKALERAWKAAPGDRTVALLLGSSRERTGRVADAIAVYDQAAAANPGDVVTINNLASLLLEQPNDKAGLKRALDLVAPFAGASDAVLLDTVGWAYFRNADYPNAIRSLERAVALSGTDPLLQYHLGKAYAAAGNTALARQHLGFAADKGGAAPFVADARAALGRLGG